MARSRSLADLIGQNRTERPTLQGQTPGSGDTKSGKTQGSGLGKQLAQRGIEKAVNSLQSGVTAEPVVGTAPMSTTGPGVGTGVFSDAAVGGAATGSAGSAAAGAAASAAAPAAAASAVGAATGGAAVAAGSTAVAGGVAAGAGGAAALAVLCHATAEYYPRDSDDWLSARQWLMVDWKGPIARRFQSWYTKHSVGLAYYINTIPVLKWACRPFFSWALRKGKESDA